MDQNKKNEALTRCKVMSKMPDVVSSLHHSVGANDIEKTTECVQFLADILSILDICTSPHDRLSIAGFQSNSYS